MIFYLIFFIIFSSTSPKVVKLNMSKAITIMLSDNNDIKAQRSKLFFAKNKIREANSYRYPSFDAFFNLAPSPKISGDINSAGKDWSVWGSYIKFGAKLIQPLYTFGLIDAGIEAAKSNLDLEKSKLNLKKSELILLIKKYYYSYQLAKDLADIAEDGKKKFDEALKVSNDLLLKRKIKKEDVYQLKMAFQFQ